MRDAAKVENGHCKRPRGQAAGVAFSAAATRHGRGARADFATSSHELREVVNKLHGLGCGFPNHNQIESLGTRVVLTAIGQSIFKGTQVESATTIGESAAVSRRSWSQRWIKTIEDSHVRPLLGEPEQSKEKADAA